MPYTQKDLCRAFHITRNTLRHYEALGIITPKVDERNGYRSYGQDEIKALHDCRVFRSMGLSLAEAKELMYGSDFDRQASSYLTCAMQAAERARLESMRADHLALQAERLKGARERIGTYYTLDLEDLVFVGVERGDELILGGNWEGARVFMHEHVELCALAVEAGDLGAHSLEWGLAMAKDHYQVLGGPDPAPRVLGGAHVLACVVAESGGGDLGVELSEGLVRAAQARGISAAGRPFGLLLARSVEGGRQVRYIEAMMPIRV